MGRRNGSPAADMDKVRQAARQSGAEGFIAEWAGQYEQMVGRNFPTASTPPRASSRSWRWPGRSTAIPGC